MATSNTTHAVILTDSRSTLQHIARCTSGMRSANVAYVIIQKIMHLKKNGVDLRLQWIASHTGIRGNEVADHLAKEAVINGTEVYILPEVTDVLVKFKFKVHEQWKLLFNIASADKGIWYKILQPEPPRTPWCGETTLNRILIVTAHGLRSGHMPLNDFEYLMGRAESPACSLCGVRENVHHLLVECGRSESMRNMMRSKFSIDSRDMGMFNGILSAPTCNAARTLFACVLEVVAKRKEESILFS